MSYVWVIEDKLAVSPLPSFSDIDELSRVFNRVVVLIEPHELPFGWIGGYINKWLSRGVEVYYAPTPDFHPVDLLELRLISKWIDNAIREGGRVLIHCRGGIGRSGVVAASYLASTGLDVHRAISFVRSIRPGALETPGQVRVVEDYGMLLKLIDMDLFDKHLGFLKRRLDEASFKHVSKTLQLTIELHQHLGIGIKGETVYASLYHCLDEKLIGEALRTNLLNQRILGLINSDSPEALIIKLAHELDSYRDSRIVYTESSRTKELITIELFCRSICIDLLDKVNEPIELLSKRINKQLELKIYPYG